MESTINPLRDDLLLDPIKYKDGYIAMPSDRPGLGVELSDEIIAKYPYNPNQCVQKGQFWPHT